MDSNIKGDDSLSDHRTSPRNESSSDEDEESYEDGPAVLRTFNHSDDSSLLDIWDHTHSDKLTEDLNRARKEELLCDIKLLIGPKKHQINAHRLILSMKSDYFKAMFATDLKECGQSEVHLPKHDLSTMETLVEFAYTGDVQVGNRNIEKITRAANFFGMSSLLKECTEYITERTYFRNCIEILEFAELTGNDDLKASAKNYILENFERVSTQNLDIVDMSTSLLLEIIADDSATIHPDPSQNEEKLFQIGWNHIRAKPGDEFQMYLFKLLRAVHLPQVSDEFLHSLTAKLEDCEDLKTIINEAKHISNRENVYDATTMKPKIDDNLRWRMSRFQNSGKCSVTCKDLNNDLISEKEWYGMPVFIHGIVWCLHAKIETVIEGPPVKYLAVYIHFLRDSNVSVMCKRQFELVAASKSSRGSHFTSERCTTYDETSTGRGYKRFMKLNDVLEDYYNNESDSCTVIGYIRDVTFESDEDDESI